MTGLIISGIISVIVLSVGLFTDEPPSEPQLECVAESVIDETREPVVWLYPTSAFSFIGEEAP